MRLYSWNVWCDNDAERAFSFIQELQFDALFLQEVTPRLLILLKALPFHLSYVQESVRTHPNKQEENYSAILSPHPLHETTPITLPEFRKALRGRALDTLMRWSYATQRRALVSELELNGQRVRLVCAHLTLSTPAQRALELEAIFDMLRTRAGAHASPAIVAGDFNILESAHIKTANWVSGAPLAYAMPWFDERGSIEALFAREQLQNPLRTQHTHTFARSQLDHILLSHHFELRDMRVLADAHGSDHRPIFIEAALPSESQRPAARTQDSA